jgi:hypothetical protein
MLAILDESLPLELEQGGGAANAVLSALTICAQAAREGTHILFASRSVYQRLRAYHDQLDRRTTAVLLRAEERLTQLGQMRDFVERALRVSVVPPPSVPHRIANGKRVELVLPVDLIDQHSSLLAAPVLMVENINDGRCYLKIAASVVLSGQIPELSWLHVVPLRSDIQPGGGNTLAALFSHVKVQGERIGIAFADSDVRYPGGANGATATALHDVATVAPVSALLEHHVIGVRTIENCIPRAELRAIAAELDPVQLYRFERQEAVFASSPFWKVVPVKAGIRCFEVGQASSESQFWTALLGGRTCAQGPQCATKKRCSTYKIPPVSDQLLARAVLKPADLTITRQCLDGMTELWRDLVVLLYSIFCGGERVTVL